jgi:UDP-N-acetylglucosamine 2-epimerase (non-hydrolysing)/GDP/UDP-N,N'-diacetylbacillosamine 2-epimerase (hydrolysing)
MKEIDRDPSLTLQVVATGMHFSPELGLTVRDIENDGFTIHRRVEMILASDTEVAVVKSIGVGLISFADVLKSLKPQVIVLLGDRYELFSVAVAALILRIPVAHLHGGETSQGAIDEAVRHSITKIASIHFPATEIYRRRIIQMGEDPDHVFNLGSPGLDAVYKLKLMDRQKLQDRLGFDLTGTVGIVTYHPVTLEGDRARSQIQNIIRAIRETGIKALFTKANADAYGSTINATVADFCATNPARYRLFDSLGQLTYLSCLKNLDLMVGNSSSGLIEAPSFRLPVVNVGERQRGRIRAENVIDVGYGKEEIVRGIEEACSHEFREKLKGMSNPYDTYGDGETGHRIKEKLKEIEFSPMLLKKEFRDIIFEGSF